MRNFRLFCFILIASTTLCNSTELNQNEVRALKEIAKKLGIKEWNFSKDPCSGEGNWSRPVTVKGFESSVTCNCSSTCHVVTIALKGQNLSGGVPPEFAKFRHLKHLDLSRNYFNGSIPSQWATLNLTDLSFMGNRLSGPFPKVITKMTSLVNLSLEGNQFSGAIPSDIGRLVNLQKL